MKLLGSSATICALLAISGSLPPSIPPHVLAATTAGSLVRGPYLQQATDTSIRVVWATRESGVAEVRYRTGTRIVSIAAATRRVTAATSGLAADYYHHESLIEGLTPATTYPYNVALTGFNLLTQDASFRTAPRSGTGAVSFVAFGDSGTGSTAQRQLATLINLASFDLALHTGDIAYATATGTGDAGWRTYDEWFFSIYSGWLPRRPVFTAEGNHDSRPSNGDGRAYLSLFALPPNGASGPYPEHAERYYSFDYGPVHFVALDTEFAFQSATRRTEQLSWLEADLAATRQPWKIAFFHRSPYSSGAEHGSDLAVRTAFAPILERYGVRLALSAHEHTYERTKPIGQIAGAADVVYIVTGGGGAPLYPAGTDTFTALAKSAHHYLYARADECLLSVEAIGLDGRVFDRVSLRRCDTPSPPDVVRYASQVVARAGAWTLTPDSTAAGNYRLRHPDAGGAKITTALSSPQHFTEFTFDASAGTPYRLWLRGRADANSPYNDSVFVQFSGSVTSAGASAYRIGTTSAAEVNLEACKGCGLAGWGWQDNGWGVGVLGPAIYFAKGGPQRVRIQTREDGFSFDQIVLSPSRYRSQSPGALKNDTTIVQ